MAFCSFPAYLHFDQYNNKEGKLSTGSHWFNKFWYQKIGEDNSEFKKILEAKFKPPKDIKDSVTGLPLKKEIYNNPPDTSLENIPERPIPTNLESKAV